MIKVTRLNQNKITINAEMIETVEETPDTIITLANGKKIIVQETLDEVIRLVVEYKGNIFSRFMN